MNKQLFTGLSERINGLWNKIKNIKHEQYLSFTLTIRINEKGLPYCEHSIYTPSLNHNRFRSKKNLIEFLESIPDNFDEFQIVRLRDTIVKLEESIKGDNRELKNLKLKVATVDKIKFEKREQYIRDCGQNSHKSF